MENSRGRKDPRDYSDEAEPCKPILGAAELLFTRADFFELGRFYQTALFG
jgi:hypothetical protein